MIARVIGVVGLLFALAACADVHVISNVQPFHTAEEYAPNVVTLAAAENKSDARRYWLDTVVKAIENAPLPNDPELPLACLKSVEGETLRTKGALRGPDADLVIAQDQRFYALIAQSHNVLAADSAKLVAVMQAADNEYPQKDEFKELALRAVVGYERLLDHHRFLLAQLKKSGCISDAAPSQYKFTDEALAPYQQLVKDIKTTTDSTGDLTNLALVSFTKYAEPLAQRRAYVARVDLLTFLHHIYADSTAEAEQACGQLAAAPKADAFRLYACGYFYEKVAKFDEAKRTYDRLKSVSTGNLAYVAAVKKRSSYIDDYAASLADPGLGQAMPNYQVLMELR